jgi:hypothetical protein
MLAVPSHGCHVFPLVLHAKHAQTMLCDDMVDTYMPGWNTLYVACKTAAYNPTWHVSQKAGSHYLEWAGL